MFNESYFKNKQDNIVLFKEIKDNMLIFEYKDYLQNLIETKTASIEEYNRIPNQYEYTNNTSYIEWKRI